MGLHGKPYLDKSTNQDYGGRTLGELLDLPRETSSDIHGNDWSNFLNNEAVGSVRASGRLETCQDSQILGMS